MSIYSPSSREDFSFCPRMWWFRKNGYTTRSIGYPELCAMGGNAVGKAMEQWNLLRMEGIEAHLGALVECAQETLNASVNKEQQSRQMAGSKEETFLLELPSLVEMAVRLLHKDDPLKRYAILSAEESFSQAGGSRLDVRVKQADGRQIVFDYKVKFGDMEEKWLNKEFEKHFTGEQRLTYTHLTGTDMFGIIMVLLKPMKDKKKLPPRIELRTSPVSPEEQQVWLRDALLMTPLMDHTLTIQAPQYVVGKTYPHSNQYGPCKFEDACIRYGLDPEKMSLDFIQIKKAND